MEPQAVVEINNRLQQARLNESDEVERILNDLTAKIAEYNEELSTNISILGEIDSIFARARLGQNMKATMPTLNDHGFINMQDARHQLIPLDQVEASVHTLGEELTAIVIPEPI